MLIYLFTFLFIHFRGVGSREVIGNGFNRVPDRGPTKSEGHYKSHYSGADQLMQTICKSLKIMARPEGFEPPILCLEGAQYKILSAAFGVAYEEARHLSHS
jgi:hypothetical protein